MGRRTGGQGRRTGPRTRVEAGSRAGAKAGVGAGAKAGTAIRASNPSCGISPRKWPPNRVLARNGPLGRASENRDLAFCRKRLPRGLTNPAFSCQNAVSWPFFGLCRARVRRRARRAPRSAHSTNSPRPAHSTNSPPPARSTNPPRPARFRSAPIPRRAVAVAPIHPPTDRPLRTLPVAPVAHLASPKTKPQARQARPSHLGAPTEHRANRKPLRMRIKQRRCARHRAEAPEAHASGAFAIHRHPGRREGKDASGESGS